MSVPVSPKFPTILRDLVDKSKKVPDIDLSNVGGGGITEKNVPYEYIVLPSIDSDIDNPTPDIPILYYDISNKHFNNLESIDDEGMTFIHADPSNFMNGEYCIINMILPDDIYNMEFGIFSWLNPGGILDKNNKEIEGFPFKYKAQLSGVINYDGEMTVSGNITIYMSNDPTIKGTTFYNYNDGRFCSEQNLTKQDRFILILDCNLMKETIYSDNLPTDMLNTIACSYIKPTHKMISNINFMSYVNINGVFGCTLNKLGENDILEAYEYDIPFFGGSISNYDYQYVGFQGKYYKYKDFYNGGGLAFNAIRANTVFQIIKTIENKDVENLNGVNPLIFTLPNGDGYTPFGIIMDFICNWNNNNIPDITIAENSYTVSVLNGAAAYHTKITQEM